jgi:hypothetical protein
MCGEGEDEEKGVSYIGTIVILWDFGEIVYSNLSSTFRSSPAFSSSPLIYSLTI